MDINNSNTPLKGINEIKQYFKNNKTLIYFISATNFNLLGIDEWVSNFKYISYIDSYNGQHPNVFSPKEVIPHDDFTSIEDINNYLLTHPEVIAYIDKNKTDGQTGKALFLMFDEKTEQLTKSNHLNICFPSAKLRTALDHKVNTNRIAEKAGVPCVPNILPKVNSFNHLKEITKHLGDRLVIQTPYGDSGHTTFFISNEDEFNTYADQILKEDEVKIMKHINCYGTALEGCVTKHGTIVTPLMTELIGFKQLTPYQGGWCGNEIYPNAFTVDIKEKAKKYAQQFGDQLKKEGYKGYFELDFLIDLDNGEIYLGELNPRVSGISFLNNHSKYCAQDIPLFLFHLLEWMNIPYEIDANEITNKWHQSENIDSWSQLIVKHTPKTIEVVTQAPNSGIWEMKKNGNIQFQKSETNHQSIIGDNEAFFLQISQKNTYLNEGVDLGILVMRGRLMSDDFKISERAKRWIKALKAQYKSDIIDTSKLSKKELLALEATYKTA